MASYKELLAQLEAKRAEEQELYAAINKAREAHETKIKEAVSYLTEVVKDGLANFDVDDLADLKPLTIVVGADDAVTVRVGSVVAPRASSVRSISGIPSTRQIRYQGKVYSSGMALVEALGLPQPASKFSALRLLRQHNIEFEAVAA